MKQIIIADPKKENILNAMLLLEKNCVIFPARTSSWMMKVLKQKNIDLIVMNVNLDSEKEAISIMEKIRKSEKYKNVPFVITSTDSRNNVAKVKKCVELGKCDAIMLPLDKKEIRNVVLHSNI